MMAKYGRSLRFGYAPDLSATEPTRPLQLAAQAEALGLDYLGIWERPDAIAPHDTWTLLTAIGMTTSRISLIANVGDLGLRPPALLAKAATTLARLTEGRLELGLNQGTPWERLMRVAGEERDDRAALGALDEAIQVMRLMWSGERAVRFAGQYHQLAEVNPGLPPARHIGIWLGVNTPHALALTGRVANGWLADAYPTLQRGDLAQLGKHIDDAATSAGRQPREIQRIWSISGTISNAAGSNAGGSTPFQGSVEQWAEMMAEVTMDAGIDTFVLEGRSAEDEDAQAQLEKFAREVVPRTRQIVAASTDAAVATGVDRAYLGARASGATVAEEETDNVDWVDETSMESFPASDPPASSNFT